MATTTQGYSSSNAANACLQVVQAKELDKLDTITNRLRSSASRIQSFLDGFYGSDSCHPAEESESGSYVAALSALETVADRVDSLSIDLRKIG